MKIMTDDNGNSTMVAEITGKAANIAGGAVSEPLDSGIYRLAAEANLHYVVGKDDELAAGYTDIFMPAGLVEYIYIKNGNKIAVLDGTLNIVKV